MSSTKSPLTIYGGDLGKRFQKYSLSLGLLLLIALVNIHALSRGWRFHPDEALYMTFARNAAVQGDWLLHGPLDKPPLSIYSSALSMMFVGVQPIDNGVLDLDIYRGEFAARLPNVLAAIIAASVAYRLALELYPSDRFRNRIALITLTLTGLSPFFVAFSATAFTDMLLLLFLLLSWWMVLRNRPAWSEFFFICAFASKPQAVFYLPLLMFFAWGHIQPIKQALIRFITPILTGILLLILWDVARNEIDIWTLGSAHYRTPGITPLTDIFARLSEWSLYAQYLLGYGWLTGVLTVLTLPIVFIKRHKTDMLLLLWLLGYIAIHTFTTIEIYDRYVLLMLVPLALIVSHGLAFLLQIAQKTTIQRFSSILLVIAFIGLFVAGWDSSEGRVPLAAHGEGRQEIDTIANYLNSKPVATVIYDPWLSWDLGYYMGAWSDKRRVYYPTPESLVSDALALGETATRYLVGKSETETRPWLDALKAANFVVTEDYHAGRFTVYALIPPVAVEDASNVGASSPDQASGGD